MNRQEIEIEIRSYREVLKQFNKGDARMSISLDNLLKTIENKIRELQIQLNGT